MNDIIYEEQKQLIKMWKDKYYEKKEEIERLNNIINEAIEYIENNVLSYIDEDGLESITDKEENELLNILRGEDKR